MYKTKNITQEIVELNEILNAYNHYLCSYEAQKNVENYTYILENKAIVSHYLKALRAQTTQAQQQKRTLPQHTLREKHIPCPIQLSAITHFNADRRFTITE